MQRRSFLRHGLAAAASLPAFAPSRTAAHPHKVMVRINFIGGLAYLFRKDGTLTVGVPKPTKGADDDHVPRLEIVSGIVDTDTDNPIENGFSWNITGWKIHSSSQPGAVEARGRRKRVSEGPNGLGGWLSMEWVPDPAYELSKLGLGQEVVVKECWPELLKASFNLSGGTIFGGPPTEEDSHEARWRFSTKKGNKSWKQAITDVTRYEFETSDYLRLQYQELASSESDKRDLIIRPFSVGERRIELNVRISPTGKAKDGGTEARGAVSLDDFKRLLQFFCKEAGLDLPICEPPSKDAKGTGTPCQRATTPGRYCPGAQMNTPD